MLHNLKHNTLKIQCHEKFALSFLLCRQTTHELTPVSFLSRRIYRRVNAGLSQVFVLSVFVVLQKEDAELFDFE